MEMLKFINPITTDRRKKRKLQRRTYISKVSFFIIVIYQLSIKGRGEKCDSNFITLILYKILSIFHLYQRVQTLFGMSTDMIS